MKNILQNSGLMFLIGILLGLVAPTYSEALKPYITLLLFVAMTFSLEGIKLSMPEKKEIPEIVFTMFLTFFNSLLWIFLTLLFIKNPAYVTGLIVLAATPPAVAVITYTFILKGDMRLAVFSESLIYLLSIFLTPIFILAYFGSSVNIFYLVKMLVILILIPLLLSRFLPKINKHFITERRITVNIIFLILFYIIIGINHVVFLNLNAILPLIILTVAMLTAVPFIIYILFRKKKELAITLVAFSTFKNGGLAAAICLALFTPESVVPIGVRAFFAPLSVILFSWLEKRF